MKTKAFDINRNRAVLIGAAILVLAVGACAQSLQSTFAPEMGMHASAEQWASLRPGRGLVWQRTSPSVQQPDGPVLYQLLFNASGVPGTVPVFDTNPRHLANSPITVTGGNIVIGGGSGLSINGGSGIITFASGQTFPASGSLAGEVTGPADANVVSNAVSTNTANAIVRRDGTGSFAAGSVTMSGNLALPFTTSSSVGVITVAGTPFVHSYGSADTFVGAGAGNFTITGGLNTAIGYQAYRVGGNGQLNVALGYIALGSATNFASNNTALGSQALVGLTSGDNNIGVGTNAGNSLTTGSNNIYIDADAGAASESNTLRIGGNGAITSAFIQGIFNGTSATGTTVFVNSAGKLGTTTSSRRYKQDIADLGAESEVLMKLRPVAFYYKPELDETHTRQYGLVAEEVAAIAPHLVVFDEQGKPQTVRYHFVNAMLLNEVQKQRRLIEALQSENEGQHQQLSAQEQQMKGLEQHLREMMVRLEVVEASSRSQARTREVAASR
jgi:hypothetical protein